MLNLLKNQFLARFFFYFLDQFYLYFFSGNYKYHMLTMFIYERGVSPLLPVGWPHSTNSLLKSLFLIVRTAWSHILEQLLVEYPRLGDQLAARFLSSGIFEWIGRRVQYLLDLMLGLCSCCHEKDTVKVLEDPGLHRI